ncbi:hypothetical protein SUGI_0588120 [Cryptomeria japonica]|uniref:uncharacterized protein LOC131064188 n=1 Tax=Cryptomeria japonica TaxID=3369 RepID=UPI002414AE7C|nr:uncharacterized protein LOC131064188 [Cryptomeria japonica]GLJ29782.1 hypothetical protein SUGI_0588120 [Cryptomeria japonica]
MSSIQVPELYRQNILEEKLEIGKSRLEQTENHCRKQLPMSHNLGVSVNGVENHPHLGQVDIESGKCLSSQEQEGVSFKSGSGIMSSIQVPELYRQNILQEELEIGKSRKEQTESHFMKQLSMSHNLGVSINGDEIHPHLGQVEIESGKCISSQEQEEVPVKSSSCKAFSIRSYVTNIRETDISKCWPFPLHLLQRRMGKHTVPILPLLEVPTFRYWQCLDCLVSEFNLDSFNEIKNDQQQLDNLMNAMPINGDAKFPIELSENEHEDSGNDMENRHLSRKAGNDLEEDEARIKVAECMEIGERSGDASVENHKEIHHSEERVTSHGTVKELTLKNVPDGDNLYSKYEIIACNATVWPTDSEETSSAKHSLSGKDDDQVLSNCTSQLRAETNISNFTEKEDHINYMHCTVNKAAMYELDENAFYEENFENRTEEEPMEALISSIEGDNTLASSIVANLDEEGCATEVDNDGIPPIVKKYSSKRQKGKVKLLKKRLISDLIAVVPNKQLSCNEENWKSKLKHMSRRGKIEMLKISKASLHNSQEFKAQAEPNLEFVDDKRKLQCQDISCQSLPPEKSVKEERRVIKRRFGSKKLGSPQKELLSKVFKKKVPEEELVHNGLQKKPASHLEDDLLNDLAHFMAKNQFERHATAPRTHNRKKTGFLKDSLAQNKEAEDGNCFLIENKSDDPIQFDNDQSLKDKLVKGTDASTKHAAVDGEVHLLIEDCKKINQVQESGKHDKQETSGQTVETDVNLDAVVGISSSLNHHGCKNTEKVDKTLKRDASGQSVTTGNDIMIKDQRNSGFGTLQSKSIVHPGKLFKSNHDDSTKHVTVDSETRFLTEDGKKINQVPESGKHEKQKTTGQDKEEYSDFFTLQKKSIEHLGKLFKSDCDDSAKHVTVDSEIHLLVEESKKINQVQQSGKHEKQKTSGQDKEAHVEDTVIGISSSSDHHTCQNTEAVDRNVKATSSYQSVCDEGTGNDAIIKAQKNNGSCILKNQSIEHLGKPLKSNHDQLSNIEQCSASLDAAVHGLSSTSFEGRGNGLDESVPSNACRDDIQSHNNGSEKPVPKNPCNETCLNTLQTVAETKKTKVGDRHRITVPALGTGRHCTENKEVKQVQLDGRTAPPIVPPLFQFDAPGNPLKSNHDQPSIIEQSNTSLDASIYDFSATSFEVYDDGLDESAPHNSHNDDLHNHNDGSEQAVPKSTCKNTSLITSQTVEMTKKTEVGDRQRIAVLALGKNCAQNMDVKQVQADSGKAAPVVLPPFQSNVPGETSKSNGNQMSPIEQSNASLDASFHGFSATGFECYDDGLDQSVPSNSCKDTLHSQNIDSEHSVPKSACKDTSLNTYNSVAVTTSAQINAAVPVQPDLSLHYQSRMINPNLITDVENSTNSNLKAPQMYHTESYLKGNRDYTSFYTGCNPLLSGPQPTIGENFITNLSLSSTEREFMCEGSIGIVKQRKGQICQKQGTCETPPIRTFPVLSSNGQQPLKLLNGFPDFSMEHKPSNEIGFQPSIDCNLPCNITNTTSLGADPMTNADKQQPLRSPIILSFSQGNKLDTQTTLSRECFDQSKFELLSYIEKRIQHYCSGKAPKRIATQKAEKGPQDEDFQIAASQDPNFCSINKNVVEHIGLKDSLTKKRKVGNKQRIAVLALSADRHSTQNNEAKQVQPDSSTTPAIVLPLFQSKALETVMKISDGQSCRSEMLVEGSHGYTYHQSIFPGENMSTILENPDKQIPKRRKISKGKQAQIESQSLEVAAVALSETNFRKEKVNSQLKVTVRNNKLSDSACLKNRRHTYGSVLSQKHANKVEIEATKTNRKLKVQSHSIQTETCAMDNHTSPDDNPSAQELSSVANQFAGFKHVLKPIAHDTPQYLPVPPVPFIADKNDEAAEASLKFSKMNMIDSKKKLKVKSQLPAIHNSYNLQAIGNYIKWGKYSVELPSSQAQPSKNGAGMSFQPKIDQNGNTNIGIPYHTSSGNINILNPVCSGVSIMPGLLKPLGMSEQQALLCQIQEYLDKPKLHVSSFTHADKPLSTSIDSSSNKT